MRILPRLRMIDPVEHNRAIVTEDYEVKEFSYSKYSDGNEHLRYGKNKRRRER